MKKSQTLADPTSPSRLALYSYVLFLVAWLFPPDIYTSVIHEPDMMFLNPELFFFFTICTLAFVGGVRSVRWVVRDGPSQVSPPRTASIAVLCAPMIFCTIWATAYLRDVGAHINLAAILIAQQGETIKEAEATLDLSTGRLALSIPFLVATLWWSYGRFKQQNTYSIAAKRIFWTSFVSGVCVGALVCIAMVDRTTLMPLVVGVVILTIHNRFTIGRLDRKKLVLIAFTVFGSVIALFSLLSYLRGFNSSELILWTVMGYSIASFNRMAAVLSGLIPAAFPGKHLHLVYYLLESSRFESIFHFREALSWPNSYTLWQLEFPQVYSHGLNGSFVWLGFFGYIYTDIGWFTPLYIYIIGFLSGLVWLRFQQRRVLGLIFYPWFAFSIIFWLGWAIIFSETFFYFLEVAFLLWLYESYLFRNPEPTMVQ